MVLDEETLFAEIVASTRAAFDECRRKAEGAKIVGYSLSTDDTGLMFVPAICVESAKGGQVREDHLFDPSTWIHVAAPETGKRVGEKLLELYNDSFDEENDDNWHEQFRSRSYQLLVRALESLQRTGYFGENAACENLFTIVWVVNSDVPNIRGRAWSKRLHSPAMHLRFIQWLDSKRWSRA